MTPPHSVMWDLGAAPAGVGDPFDVHPIGDMDPADPARWRLSAEAERRAAIAWRRAAVASTSSVEVLACTQLGRTALRQAAAYDVLAGARAGVLP